jgi:16S rRNA (uracil1498-N3)-methyltransferase
MSFGLFLLDPLPDSDVVVLDGAEGRHAATVRRIGVGERILLADGHGRQRVGIVSAVGRDRLEVACEPATNTAPPQPRLVVVQALPKGDRAELAIELMTELGVDEIVPWSASRSIVSWRGERADKSLGRWRRGAQEAGKQSRRARFPVVSELADTRGVCARLASATGLVLHEDAQRPLASCPLPADGEIVLVVGPEGGIAADELAAFAAVGALAVRLGTPVLRTSTAGGAALAALSVRLQRWA